MLDKLKAAIAKAREEGREIPAVIEELFLLILGEAPAPAPAPANTPADPAAPPATPPAPTA